MWFDTPAIRTLIDLALTEDIGTGDAATLTTVDPELMGSAGVWAKSEAIIAGGPLFALVMQRLDPTLVVTQHVAEGQRVTPGTRVLTIVGRVSAILTAERLALNFIGRMSGIATYARACADAVAHTDTIILDTRKTLPGFRSLDKYAVRTGGCGNHRTALDAGILIKENHIMAAGGVAQAVKRARSGGSHLLKVEVELEALSQLEAAIAAGADVVMLDNMTTAELSEGVTQVAGRVQIEASGNMTLPRLAEVAETGVDFISLGGLTHTVTVADLSLRLDK
ncbi:MAG: carboxylating nicotinate-nucleotide diphosphorylase [Myxococcales bacterium]|nr:carboxylating nicotinate-nucleotide diphosphorylase [Myxococcales bacterium]